MNTKLFRLLVYVSIAVVVGACSRGDDDEPPPVPSNFIVKSWDIGGTSNQTSYNNLRPDASIRFSFGAPLDRTTVASSVRLQGTSGGPLNVDISYANADSSIIVTPSDPLPHLSRYTFTVTKSLKSVTGGSLSNAAEVTVATGIDSSAKFPLISDDSLLTVVQRQHFKYFWDFAHPESGLARERNTSGDIVTSGGSGFGIMAIVVGIDRQFISRGEGLARMQKIVSFLKTKSARFHGAFPHWLNGSTGAAVPFSSKDDGADLVETSYLIQGLLAARQYFNSAAGDEAALRADIDEIWKGVEWSWFRRNNEEVLYWHWSPNFEWEMNHPVSGWNECLITYVLAASSPQHSIPKSVYDNGWARGGAIRNNGTYYGVQLPLGPANGGPLFFAHYSFLGLDPKGLSDQYANYFDQNRAHTLINYNYSKANPKNYFGYSESVWGLTASDNNKSGYAAHEPNNDLGVISPTAAISSMPYTPEESMRALKFFYYQLGDKIWKEYGFVDAFNLTDLWFANSFLAIDQGPIVIMIENHRSQLLWNLFMSAPEVKAGLIKLGFQSPHL
jgi:hypothetical protein